MDNVLDWSPAAGLVSAGPTDDSLLVADSWFVEDGLSRGIERHRRRFAAGCAEAANVPEELVDLFWRAAMHALPREGELFPRVELLGGAEARFRLRIRSAPPRGAEIRVWTAGRVDPRRTPRRKGPDLARLGALRSAAQEAGADDVLLATSDGLLLESGTASLIWWEQETLCVPDPDLPVLTGVTTRLIQEAAASDGVEVAYRRARLEELEGRETWLVNALHGVRPVTAWVGSAVTPGPALRAPEWRKRWQAAATPL